MPHDKFGRKIDVGDVIAAKHWSGGREVVTAKKVMVITEGSDTCNLCAADFEPRLGLISCTAKESTLLLKADGSEPVPAEIGKTEGSH